MTMIDESRYNKVLDDYHQETKKVTRLENQLEEQKFFRNWLIFFLIVSFISILILASMTGDNVINNQGYTLEQLTNTTITICEALK